MQPHREFVMLVVFGTDLREQATKLRTGQECPYPLLLAAWFSRFALGCWPSNALQLLLGMPQVSILMRTDTDTAIALKPGKCDARHRQYWFRSGLKLNLTL